MLDEMSSQELAFWEDKYAVEFLGDERRDYQAARVEAAVKNFAGRSLAEGVFVEPADLMPYREREAEATPDQQQQTANRVQFALLALAGRQEAAERRKQQKQKPTTQPEPTNVRDHRNDQEQVAQEPSRQ